MRILLDECLPVDFRYGFRDFEAHTVQWSGLKGKKNGELLRAAEAVGYKALLTVDQGIPHQQEIAGRQISVIVIRSKTNQLEDLLPFVDEVLRLLNTIQPGEIMRTGTAD